MRSLALLTTLLAAVLPATATTQHVLTSKESYLHGSDKSLSQYKVIGLSRTLDLGGSVARAHLVYTLIRRDGAASAVPSTGFVFAIEDTVVDKSQLSWLEATSGKTSSTKRKLDIRGVGHDRERHAYFYAVDIGGAAGQAEEATVTITTVYTHASSPLPDTISQESQAQGMYWHGDLLGGAIRGLLEGDSIRSGEVKIRVKTPSPKSNPETTPASFSASHPAGASTITFTSITDLSFQHTYLASGAKSSIDTVAGVHYDYPEPILSMRSVVRTAVVSLWGNHLAVQDDVELLNDGPKLKTHFSRLTHQALAYMRRQGHIVPHTLTSFTLLLPPGIHSPYFIDEVGNVSTSRFRPSPLPLPGMGSTSSSQLELMPRYPLLGGWNYTYSYGYKQPLSTVMAIDKTRSGRHSLSVPFLTPLRNAAIDDVLLRVVLPEGATHISVAAPFPVDSVNYRTSYSYLDTSGRPTVEIHKIGCSEHHALDVIVEFDYSTTQLLRKPLAITLAMLTIFTVTAALRRVKWTLK